MLEFELIRWLRWMARRFETTEIFEMIERLGVSGFQLMDC